MTSNASASEPRSSPMACKKPVAISRWVNERYPPVQELLSAHDVARLTRRPCWMIVGLSLLGHLPRRLRFRGRCIGWRRSEILEWIARDLAVVGERRAAKRVRRRRTPRQASFPFPRAYSASLHRRHRARRSSHGASPPHINR